MIDMLSKKYVAKLLNAGNLALNGKTVGSSEVTETDILQVSAIIAEDRYLTKLDPQQTRTKKKS